MCLSLKHSGLFLCLRFSRVRLSFSETMWQFAMFSVVSYANTALSVSRTILRARTFYLTIMYASHIENVVIDYTI